jgi:flagella basal body P-ring formation protein FlgA
MFRYFYYDITLAVRFAVLALSIVLGVIVLVTGASIANAATLKSDVLLNAPVLTAGDLFDGLEKDKAAKVLGPAPQPGQDMVLNTLTLMQVAAALSIDWKPQSTGEQVVVRSATTLVDEKTITDALTKKLQDKGVTGEFSLDYFNPPKLILPKDVPATAEVASISYEPDSGRFEATLVGPDAAHQAATTQVSGHIEHTVSVPMLKKPLRNGDIIRADNIEWKPMPQNAIGQNTLVDADKLIGMTPRRMVMADTPVQEGDVAQPLLVSRGDVVTITYAKGPITVTAKGRALEDGARGSSIRVVNSASSRSIDATVSDSDLVTVTD